MKKDRLNRKLHAALYNMCTQIAVWDWSPHTQPHLMHTAKTKCIRVVAIGGGAIPNFYVFVFNLDAMIEIIGSRV